MKRPLMLSLALSGPLAAGAQTQTQTQTPPAAEFPEAAARSITGAEIGGHLRFLASDLMRGREAGSPEAKLTAEYLAAHLSAVGAEPLGDPERGGRSFFQEFMLESTTALSEGAEMTLTIESEGSARVIPCKLGSDYAYRPSGVVGGEIDAPAVFVGYGRVDAEKRVDDYGAADVRNKFVLAYSGMPDGVEAPPGAAFFAHQAKVRTAREKGAVGIILIDPPGKAASGRSMLPAKPGDLGFDHARISLGSAPAEIPAITLAEPIREVVIASLGLPAPGAELNVTDAPVLRVHLAQAVAREPREDRNVVGMLPGSDPARKDEIIIFSAHYDHEGVDEKGEIYNGSDDNASGTSGVLEVAQAFGLARRPARSVAFLWVSGEEKGLLGSKWYSDHRLLPEGAKIVADINLDMISRNDPGKIGATPSPSHRDYNTLVLDAAEATKAEGLEMQFDSDPYYGRTDSYNFAAKGIPVIFFFAGLHEDYHKPTDDFPKADLEKAARVARAAFRLGWKAAQAAEAPKKVQGQAPGAGQP